MPFAPFLAHTHQVSVTSAAENVVSVLGKRCCFNGVSVRYANGAAFVFATPLYDNRYMPGLSTVPLGAVKFFTGGRRDCKRLA